MNSSISGSETDDWRWRRVLRRYLVVTAAAAIGLAAILLLLDPYDTGRLTPLASRGVPDFGQRLAFASIARRKGVDVALLGNSTIQLLDPARLSALTGRHVVSLAVPGTGPLEQLAIAEWFRRQHRGREPLDFVFGLDAGWCTTADPIPVEYPFPFWLYAPSRLDYALNMMRYKSIEALWRKVKLLAGRERLARSDGYHDYDTGHDWHEPDFPAPAADAPRDSGVARPFTALPLLRDFASRLDREAGIVLVFVPRHESSLPPAGSAAAAQLEACKSAYRALAQARPRTRILDFLVDGALARNDENFWDTIHYRSPVARTIEDSLAAGLR